MECLPGLPKRYRAQTALAQREFLIPWPGGLETRPYGCLLQSLAFRLFDRTGILIRGVLIPQRRFPAEIVHRVREVAVRPGDKHVRGRPHDAGKALLHP